MEAWARAPHNRQVSQLMEELLALWRDDLAAIVARGVQEGAFARQPRSTTSPSASPPCSTGSRSSALRQMHQPSRKRLIELAMTTARA